MLVDQLEQTRERTPYPFPEGWYYVASREQIAKSKLLQLTWMGEEIVVWGDDDGSICVAEAYCPHLGSYLGPDAGGRVCDGRLVCPFHGFEFGTSGQCVATPNAPPPRRATLRVFETQEIAGMVFAWWGIDGRKPQWDLPWDPEDVVDLCKLQMLTMRFRGHPQETTENSVDMGHLSYVHGYRDTYQVGSVLLEQHELRSQFHFRRAIKLAGVTALTVDFMAHVLVSGLGYSRVDFFENEIGLEGRLHVMATPVDGDVIDFTIACQFSEQRVPNRRFVGMGFLPRRVRAALFSKFSVWLQRHDVMQDVTIWSRKRYQRRPRLCRSDGEIMPYRAYCAQFYPEAADDSRYPNGRSVETVDHEGDVVRSLRV
ncbi:MAG: Rieske 2Fe-2S domain-containing protein [Chloroflexi bacterium]|nr:Rieske 2Fe-2S domain-containing protein [Chloroflexota bacterium]